MFANNIMIPMILYNMNIAGYLSRREEEDEEFESQEIAPGGFGVPDDQGTLDVCTRFALSKAIAEGFMKKITVRGKQIDIDQDVITNVLLNEFKDGKGKWPHEFNRKSYQLRDKNGKYWMTHLRIQQISNTFDFSNDVLSIFQVNTYVLVYPTTSNPKGPSHCVYAEGFQPDINGGYIKCINSDPNDKFPRFHVGKKGNIIYKVSCIATEMTSPSSSPTHPAPVTMRPSSTNQASGGGFNNNGPRPNNQELALSVLSLASSGYQSNRNSTFINQDQDDQNDGIFQRMYRYVSNQNLRHKTTSVANFMASSNNLHDISMVEDCGSPIPAQKENGSPLHKFSSESVLNKKQKPFLQRLFS